MSNVVFLPARLFLLSSSRLFHTPLAPKPRCGSVLAVTLSLAISIAASGIDSSTRVSWMLLQCAMQQRRPIPIERRGGETHTRTNNPTKPPYKSQHGGRTHWQEECAQFVHVRVQNRNVQPLYFYHYPGHPLISSIKPRSPSTHHRMQSAHFTACQA